MDEALQIADSDRLPRVEGFTIDGPQSRDLDDAIWLEERGDGYFVRVCIADVASTVALDSPLDLRARERGFTRYFAAGNAPMLPRALSEDQLSLLPDVPRRVICIEMTLDSQLTCRDISARPAVLESAARLTYTQAALIAEGKTAIPDYPHDLVAILQGLAGLSKRLLAKRRARGELAYYDLRLGLALNEEGRIKRLSVAEANIGYIIIQEMMLLTNRSIAEFLLRSNVPTLFRNHEALIAAPERASLLRRVETAFAHPTGFDLETVQQNLHLVLARARYGPYATGHYGLNLPAYLHFTSPIRRYADLVNQRVLFALLNTEISPYSIEQLATLGDALNGLVDAEALKKSEGYKRRKEAETERNLKAPAVHVAALPDKDVYRVVVRAAQQGEPAEALLQGLKQRLTDERMTLKEAFAILYETPIGDATWQGLQWEALSWLRRSPQNAVSLLAMGVGLRGWPATRYAFTGGGDHFTCHAALRVDNRDYPSGAWSGTNKRAVQQQAALALCHLLCGAPPPEREPDVEPITPAPQKERLEISAQPTVPLTPPVRQNAPIQTTLPKSASPTLPALFTETLPPAGLDLSQFNWSLLETDCQAGNYISALYRLCQKTSRKHPKFHFMSINAEGTSSILCHITLQWKEGVIGRNGTGQQHQTAKQNAAQAVLNALSCLHNQDKNCDDAPIALVSSD